MFGRLVFYYTNFIMGRVLFNIVKTTKNWEKKFEFLSQKIK